jgi:DnaJ family protein C protein 2
MVILANVSPANWPKDQDFKVYGNVSPCTLMPLEPVGEGFFRHARRVRHNRSLSEDERMRAALNQTNDEEVDLEEDEEETSALLASDPLETKTQDHYAILGLSKLRWKATEDDIRRAYRRKVLKHHPDKKEDTTDDAFFKCVQYAYELMSEPTKRRQWDSVDPMFEEDLPPAKVKSSDQFFRLYGKAFENNARFAVNPPVPSLGSMDTPREEVESFYDFWYHFESWRTFEAHDEEDPDKADSRDEKRYIDRLNRAARTKRKKEDNARIITLVEQAMKIDPRLAKYKEEDKYAREEKKRSKEKAAQQEKEEKKRVEEAEKLEATKKEQEQKAKAQEEKKDRDAKKKAARKDRKLIRDIAKQHDFYLQGAPNTVLLQEAADLEELLESLPDDGLAQLKLDLNTSEDKAANRHILESLFNKQRLEKGQQPKPMSPMPTTPVVDKKSVPWSPKEVATLIKAVKMYPGGTTARWDKIAAYVSQHGAEDGEDEKTLKRRHRRPADCIAKSKDLEAGHVASDDREKLQAAIVAPKKEVDIKEVPSERLDEVESVVDGVKKLDVDEWTAAQQASLESALRKYPAGDFKENPADRWEKVATLVDGKSVKQVKNRFKELVSKAKSAK